MDLSEIDLMIVPAVAIDPRGNRIGRGGAYYDRLLATCPTIFTIGVIYDFQLIAEAPTTEGDIALNAVATDQRLIYVPKTKIVP
jgi:5-formyltetrahydrofolate cyclo-ligase